MWWRNLMNLQIIRSNSENRCLNHWVRLVSSQDIIVRWVVKVHKINKTNRKKTNKLTLKQRKVLQNLKLYNQILCKESKQIRWILLVIYRNRVTSQNLRMFRIKQMLHDIIIWRREQQMCLKVQVEVCGDILQLPKIMPVLKSNHNRPVLSWNRQVKSKMKIRFNLQRIMKQGKMCIKSRRRKLDKSPPIRIND